MQLTEYRYVTLTIQFPIMTELDMIDTGEELKTYSQIKSSHALLQKDTSALAAQQKLISTSCVSTLSAIEKIYQKLCSG